MSHNDIAPVGVAGFRERHASQIRALRLYAHTLTRSFSSLFGLALVLFFLALAAFGPSLAPFPEDAMGAIHMSDRLLPPDAVHWFGTDEMGADIYSRVLFGARISLWVALLVVGIATLIGLPLGIAAGYFGGWVRVVIMRLTDLFLSIPALALALAVVAALGPGITNCVLALSLAWWPGYVRLVEAKTLTLKEELFIESARSIGARAPWIMWHHILPNCLSPVIVKVSLDIGMAILAAASLGFIGLGARPPSPESGAMISVGRTYMPDWWWYSLFPGAAISLTVLGFNLLGDGLRDILDPRSRQR